MSLYRSLILSKFKKKSCAVILLKKDKNKTVFRVTDGEILFVVRSMMISNPTDLLY